MQTISVLGSGWLGLPLAKAFVYSGYNVKASTTRLERQSELHSVGIKSFVIDIANLNDRVSLFLQSEVLIINITSKQLSDFIELVNVIERSKIKKVIFISSTSVLRTIKKFNEQVTEQNEPPLLAIENLFRSSHAFDTTIIRFSGLVGYSRHPGRFFQSGKWVQNPDAKVNLIHRDDCINIIQEVIRQQCWGDVFNCCADTHPSKRDFYSQTAKSIGLPAPNFSTSTSTSNHQAIVSNEKIKRVLNYTFKYGDLMDIKF
jgi:nucleoside-diphosphate-sugar epimerase